MPDIILSDFSPEIDAKDRERLDALFSSFAAKTVNGSRGKLASVEKEMGTGVFDILPPALETPGFRICGTLDDIEDLEKTLSGSPFEKTAIARLRKEKENFESALSEYFFDADINCDYFENHPEFLHHAGQAASLLRNGGEPEGFTGIFEAMAADWEEFRRARMSEEGIFCLEAAIRQDLDKKPVLDARISFAPYYDFNEPLFRERLEGNLADACARIMDERFPALAETGKAASRPRMQGV